MKSDYYDAKVVGILIDEPKEITKEQVEKQVDELNFGMLSHVFASCDAPLAKAPFAKELATEWTDSKDNCVDGVGIFCCMNCPRIKRKSQIWMTSSF